LPQKSWALLGGKAGRGSEGSLANTCLAAEGKNLEQICEKPPSGLPEGTVVIGDQVRQALLSSRCSNV